MHNRAQQVRRCDAIPQGPASDRGDGRSRRRLLRISPPWHRFTTEEPLEAQRLQTGLSIQGPALRFPAQKLSVFTLQPADPQLQGALAASEHPAYLGSKSLQGRAQPLRPGCSVSGNFINHSAETADQGRSQAAGSRQTTLLTAAFHHPAMMSPPGCDHGLTQPGEPPAPDSGAARAWVPRRKRPGPSPHIPPPTMAQGTEMKDAPKGRRPARRPRPPAEPCNCQRSSDWGTTVKLAGTNCSMAHSAGGATEGSPAQIRATCRTRTAHRS